MFDIVEGNIEVSTSSLNIPEYKAIWKRDKGRAKLDAHAELSYIYFMCDYKSEFRNFPESQREEKIRASFTDKRLGEKWKPDDKVEAAMKLYREMQETPSLRYLKSQEAMIDKITDYMNSVQSEDFEDNDKLLDSIGKAQEKFNKIITTLPKLREVISKEVSESTKIRGGGDKGKFEDLYMFETGNAIMFTNDMLVNIRTEMDDFYILTICYNTEGEFVGVDIMLTNDKVKAHE